MAPGFFSIRIRRIIDLDMILPTKIVISQSQLGILITRIPFFSGGAQDIIQFLGNFLKKIANGKQQYPKFEKSDPKFLIFVIDIPSTASTRILSGDHQNIRAKYNSWAHLKQYLHCCTPYFEWCNHSIFMYIYLYIYIYIERVWYSTVQQITAQYSKYSIDQHSIVWYGMV